MELTEQDLIGLVERARSGDKDAFGEIVSAYQGMVTSVSYSVLGEIDRSEDVAQETFIAAWRKLRDLREIHKLPGWLCSIARNLARSARRSQLRDPLAGAGELPLELAAESESARETLSREEREAILWQTLSVIPDEYREPLVLFYREGQSVRAVAQALDISENTARQRLSRGRSLLRTQVARVVEDTLSSTRPGQTFTIAVLAALPLTIGQTATAAVVSTGAATAGKGSVAGAAALLGSGMAGAFLGGVIGMTGGFFGMWKSIQNSPTLRTRRFALKTSFYTFVMVWVFLAFQALTGLLFWRTPFRIVAAGLAGWAIYIPLLVVLIVWAHRVSRRILLEDLGKIPSSGKALEQTSLSMRSTQITFAWTYLLSIVSSAIFLFWIAKVTWAAGPWLTVAMALLLLVSQSAMYFISRAGMAAARDEQSFALLPPLRTAEETWEIMTGRAPRTQPSRRALFWNDFAALAGAILGPMSAVVMIPVEQRRFVVAAVISVISLATIMVGMVLRARYDRKRVFFAICLFMGIFSSGVMWIYGPATAAVMGAQYLPGVQLWAPLIPLALYWAIGLALLITLARTKPAHR